MQLPIELSHPCYHDDEAARIQLETIRWPNGPYCPICGALDTVKPTTTPPKAKGGGWYWCTPCRRKFTVRVGSIFHRSHIPLHKWLLGFRLMAGSKKGFSAHQLHRTLKLDYKSAWFMEHRIRECMDEDANGPIGGEGKTLEADETFLSKQRGRGTWKLDNYEGRWQKRRDRRSVAVFALVERGGRARAMPINNTTSSELQRALTRHADTKSALMTDEWQAYRRPGRAFASHETVVHSEEEWTRGEAGTQSAENFFSVFKRGMRGIYQHCSEEHLVRYLHEFAFRYSHRAALGINDTERATRAIQGADGKRLLYRQPGSQTTVDDIPF
jgi:transposase-like protein